jgi:hypothetical protein
MPHYARTYGYNLNNLNQNNPWEFATGPMLDRFGIPINQTTFGIEEFNFNSFYLSKKIAFIPCYSTSKFYRRRHIGELRLVYKQAPRCYKHYATLHNVTSFADDDIPYLRSLIQPQINQIYYRQESLDFWGEDFNLFQNAIKNAFNSDIIANNHNTSSFLVNLKYEKLEILTLPITCDLGGNRASQWYINVAYNI